MESISGPIAFVCVSVGVYYMLASLSILLKVGTDVLNAIALRRKIRSVIFELVKPEEPRQEMFN